MHYLAIAIDVFHATTMVLWFIGLPLLFNHKYPKLSLYYNIFSFIFMIINISSHIILGECILTTLARYVWIKSGDTNISNDWFTIRFTKFIFGLTPSHEFIEIITGAVIVVVCIGTLYHVLKKYKKI